MTYSHQGEDNVIKSHTHPRQDTNASELAGVCILWWTDRKTVWTFSPQSDASSKNKSRKKKKKKTEINIGKEASRLNYTVMRIAL